MSNEEYEKRIEQEHVDVIVKEITQKIHALALHSKKVSSDVLEIKTTFWDDVTVNMDEPDDIAETFSSIKQQALLLKERERSKGQIDHLIKTYSRLKNSPYFGRIDFIENGENVLESIYLGITSFMDKEEENFLIYDWRAPISSMYYDYGPGPASYKTPEGIIDGEMKLKRQFIIRNSQVEGMFDTGITIGDQLLQEVLGNNSSTQMKSIVATIQREQNQIIRNDKSKVLIVQGVAGSGKTSAALQRVAYLLYRYRGKITSQNIMLFSPNPLFNSYVATVLPELGEENMQQTTFQEYLNHRLGADYEVEDSFDQLEYLLSTTESLEYETRSNSIQFKSSIDFKKIIDHYVRSLSKEGLIFKDIRFKGRTLISKEQISEQFYSFDKTYSIPNRIQLLQEWLRKELKQLKRIEKSKDWVKEEIQFLDKMDYLDVFNKLQEKKKFTENSFDDFESEEKVLSEVVVNRYFKPLVRKVKQYKFIDTLGIYSQLFKKAAELDVRILPEKWDDICDLSVSMLANNQISYEDATPFVYLQDQLEGKKTSNSIRHVFIDEAQDYSPFQYAYLRELFPYSKMTLLGDINQGIYTHTKEAVSILPKELFPKDDQETIVLTRSYRSTRPIVEFTSTILKDGGTIEAFNRNGKMPTLTMIEDQTQYILQLTKKIQELQNNGHRTIAVICKTAKESARVYEALRHKLPVWLMEKGTVSFETGVLIIPAYLAKGIEFDAVIIYNASKECYGRESERRLFYTACTRAMHELHLYSLGEISPLMTDSMDKIQIVN